MTQENLDLLIQALIPILITAASGTIIAVAKFLTDYISQKTNSNRVNHYLERLDQTILEVVEALNQTTVNPIKDAHGKLSEEEKSRIFQASYKSVIRIMSRAGLAVLADAYEDVNELILAKLEATVGAVNAERKQKEAAAAAALITAKTAAVIIETCEPEEAKK